MLDSEITHIECKKYVKGGVGLVGSISLPFREECVEGQ